MSLAIGLDMWRLNGLLGVTKSCLRTREPTRSMESVEPSSEGEVRDQLGST